MEKQNNARLWDDLGEFLSFGFYSNMPNFSFTGEPRSFIMAKILKELSYL